MNKYRWILSLLLTALWLASCSASAGDEPAALQSELEAETAAEANATSEKALQSAEEGMLEAVPVDPAEAGQAAALPESVESVEVPAVEPVVVDLSKITPEAATDGEMREMPKPGVPDPLVPLVQAISQDLADRLKIDISEVAVLETEAVEWRDSSLGCPEPGQMYLMVITPGHRIVLEAGDQSYEYHADTRDNFVFCENGKPGTSSGSVDQ